MSRFGDILSELREDRGLTQKQLAELFHVSTSAISALETGYRNPSSEMLVNIAVYFDVTTDYLLGLTKSPVSINALTEQVQQSLSVAELIEMLRKLTEPQKSALVLVLRDMTLVADLLRKTTNDGAEKK